MSLLSTFNTPASNCASSMSDVSAVSSDSYQDDNIVMDKLSDMDLRTDSVSSNDDHPEFADFANNTSGDYKVALEVKGYDEGDRRKAFQIASITFQGVKLYVVRVKQGEYMIPIKPIVYGMDLTVTGQVLRTRKHMPEDIKVLSLPQVCGGPTSLCLPIHLVSKWLDGIQLNRVSARSRPLVAAFQKECENVLYYTVHVIGETLNREKDLSASTPDTGTKCEDRSSSHKSDISIRSNNLPDNVLSENAVTKILEKECPMVETHEPYTPDDVTNEIKSLLSMAITNTPNMDEDNHTDTEISADTIAQMLSTIQQMQQDYKEFREIVTAKLDLLSAAISQSAAPLRYSVQTFADAFNVKLGTKEASKIEWDCEFMSNRKHIPISSIIEDKNGLVNTYDLSILSEVFSQVYPRIKFK